MGSAERAGCSQEKCGREEDNEGNVVVARGPIPSLEAPHAPVCVGVGIVSYAGPLHVSCAGPPSVWCGHRQHVVAMEALEL